MFLRISLLACFVVASIADVTTTRDYPMPGAPVNMTDPKEIEKLVEKVMTKYNQITNDPFYYVSVKVLSATGQMVDGFVYELKLNIGKSDCLKNEVFGSDVKLCKVQENPVIKEIHAKNYVEESNNIDKITFD